MSEITNDRVFAGASAPDSEYFEIGVAIAVLLFMTALGVWLMQPEASVTSFESSGKTDAVVPAAAAYEVETEVVGDDSRFERELDREQRNATAIQEVASFTKEVAPLTKEIAPAIFEPAEVVEIPAPVAAPLVSTPTLPSARAEPEVEIFEPVVAAEPAAPVPPEPAAETAAQLTARATDNVSFLTGSAILTEDSRAVLDDLAALLTSEGDTNLRIVGHTDAQGAADANAALSFARAEACRNYLLEKGIEVGRVDTAGFGERKPIASNLTAEGRKRNRRVEFELVSGSANTSR